MAVSRGYRPRLRTVLLVTLLVPVCGVGALGWLDVSDQWAARSQSITLRDDADALGETTELARLLSDEAAHATAQGLATDLGLDPEQLLDSIEPDAGHLDTVRADVDRLLAASPNTGRVAAELEELRQRVDAGEAGYAEVLDRAGRIKAMVDEVWLGQVEDLATAADSNAQSTEVRRRLRTVREFATALALTDDRIVPALALLLDPEGSDADVRSLIEANTRFAAAVDRADPAPGTRAAAAWEAFRTDPAAKRAERLLHATPDYSLGRSESPAAENPVDDIVDGARWATDAAKMLAGASADLEDAAAAQAEDAREAVFTHIGILAAAIGIGGGLLALVVRSANRDVGRLRDQARQLERGLFELPPLPEHGPREIADTVRAFNDMAATLAAVEDHAVAMAEDPSSPVLDEPLPGRTGRAMQEALDQLRLAVLEAEEHRQELTILATHDDLTHLLNRGAAMEAIRRDLARARRRGDELFALFVDLDGLKRLNDRHGHATGDEALRLLADALTRATRDGDIVARLSGDEFIVVGPVPDGGTDGIETLAERVRTELNSQAVSAPDGTLLALHCSVGVALSGADVDTVEELLHLADEALYRAKEGGRDQVAW